MLFSIKQILYSVVLDSTNSSFDFHYHCYSLDLFIDSKEISEDQYKKVRKQICVICKKCSSLDRMKDYETKQKRIFYSFLALNLMLTV